IAKTGLQFDVVLVDAPCSGEGLFRRDHDSISAWKPDLVAFNAQRQKEILKSIIPTIAENGHLIYSTCTYSIEENEGIILWLIDHGFEVVPMFPEEEWGFVDSHSIVKEIPAGGAFR